MKMLEGKKIMKEKMKNLFCSSLDEFFCYHYFLCKYFCKLYWPILVKSLHGVKVVDKVKMTSVELL